MKKIIAITCILFITFFLTFFLIFSQQNINFNTEFFEDYEISKIKKLVNRPVRNLENNSKIQNFLRENSVNVSMTTSPIRLKKITSNLQFLVPLKIIDTIFINVPVKYRDKEPYDLQDIKNIQNYSSKIKIIILEKDIGPIAKILPALNYVNDNDIVISIDDDIIYSPALIHELVYHTIMYDGIFSGAGFTYSPTEYTGEHIDRTRWPLKYIPKHPEKDVIEGYGCIAYRKRDVDINELLKLSQKSKNCRVSDDFVISYFLHKKGYKLYEIDNKYHKKSDLLPLSYGLGEDALHNGSGTEISEGNINLEKYKRCFQDLTG